MRINQVKRLATLASVLLIANSAYGQWKYEAVEDPFADDEISFAYIEEGLTQVGFKCQSGVYELVYVTADKTVDIFTLAAIQDIGGMKLMFRTDKDQPVTLTARLDVLIDGRLRAIGSLSQKNLAAISGMKKSIAVQLTAEDHVSNQMKFAAQGSTAALSRVAGKCKIVDASTLTSDEIAGLSISVLSFFLPIVPRF